MRPKSRDRLPSAFAVFGARRSAINSGVSFEIGPLKMMSPSLTVPPSMFIKLNASQVLESKAIILSERTGVFDIR